MDTLLELLKTSGINLDPKVVETFVRQQGLDPNTLSDDEVLQMEAHIKKPGALASLSSSITTGTVSAPTKNKRGRKQAPNFQEAAALVGQQSQADMSALVESVKAGANHFSQQAATEMIDAIADAPNQAVEHFITLAQQHKGDPASFRQLGDEIVATIFPRSEVNTPV